MKVSFRSKTPEVSESYKNILEWQRYAQILLLQKSKTWKVPNCPGSIGI
jgi:hypothetical protein